MKISVDGVELFTFTETQKKVFQYAMHKETYEATLKGLILNVVKEKLNLCFMRLENEWGPVLLKERDSLPANKERYAAEIFKHKDYKNKSAKLAAKKDKEAEKKKAIESKKDPIDAVIDDVVSDIKKKVKKTKNKIKKELGVTA